MANTRFESVLVTPVCPLIWVYLFKAKQPKNGRDPQFQTDIIFNPSAMATPFFGTMKAAANKVATEHFGAKLPGLIAADKFINPFWKNERKIDVATGKLPAGYEPGGVYITAKSKTRPRVMHNTSVGVQEIIDENDVYSGMLAHVSLDCYAYSNESNGVNFGLRSVLKMGDADPIGSGRASTANDFAGVAAPAGAASGADLFSSLA